MVRKMAHSTLNAGVAKAYAPYQDLENKQMLAGLLARPAAFVAHLRRYTTSLTTQMIFGFRTTAADDPKLVGLYAEVEELSHITGSSGGAVLDVYPALRRLPDALLPVVRRAKRSHAVERELFVGHWLDAKKAVLEGTSKVGRKRICIQDGVWPYVEPPGSPHPPPLSFSFMAYPG